MEFRDTRTASEVVVENGQIVSGHAGGWGPWRMTPPLSGRTDTGYDDGTYLCEPQPMTQDELRTQYNWAMERSDRKDFRPEVV